MDYHNFEDFVSSTIVQRGKRYYNNRAVSSLEELEDGWVAEVAGTEVYTVDLEGKKHLEEWYCDCPYDHGDTCKHVVAVLYAVREEMSIEKPKKKKKKSNPQLLDKLFKEVPAKQLLTFFRAHIGRDKDLKNKLFMEFSDLLGQEDGQQYEELIEKVLRANEDQWGYIGYREESKLLKQLQPLLKKAQKALAGKNYIQAFSIQKALLEKLPSTLEYLSGRNGDIQGLIDDAQLLSVGIVESDAAIDFKEEALSYLIVHALKIDNDYGDLDYTPIQVVKDHYKGLLPYQEVEQLYLKKLKKGKTETFGSYTQERFVRLLIDLYRENQIVEKVDELRRSYLHFPKVRKELVERYIEVEDYENAKSTIKKGIEIADKAGHPGTVSSWKSMLLDIAVKEGDRSAITKGLREKYYNRSGHNSERYHALRVSFEDAKAWEKEKAAIFTKIKKEKNNWYANTWLADLYVEEKMWPDLLSLLQKKDITLNLIIKYYAFIIKLYPKECLLLLEPLIWKLSETDGRSNYRALADFLKKLKKHKEARAFIVEIAQKIRKKYPRRPAMQEELMGI